MLRARLHHRSERIGTISAAFTPTEEQSAVIRRAAERLRDERFVVVDPQDLQIRPRSDEDEGYGPLTGDSYLGTIGPDEVSACKGCVLGNVAIAAVERNPELRGDYAALFGLIDPIIDAAWEGTDDGHYEGLAYEFTFGKLTAAQAAEQLEALA